MEKDFFVIVSCEYRVVNIVFSIFEKGSCEGRKISFDCFYFLLKSWVLKV